MASFRNLFNKSALSVTYIEHYVQQFNSIKTLSSTYTEETTRRDRNYPANGDDHQFFIIKNVRMCGKLLLLIIIYCSTSWPSPQVC